MVGETKKIIVWAFISILLLNFLLMLMPNVETASTVSLSVGEVTENSVQLDWSESGDWFFSSYVVEMDDGTGWTQITTITDIGTTSYKVTGLSSSTTYQFRITDHDILGYAHSNEVTITTKSAYASLLEFVFILIVVIVVIFILFVAYKNVNWKKIFPKEIATEKRIELAQKTPAPPPPPPVKEREIIYVDRQPERIRIDLGPWNIIGWIIVIILVISLFFGCLYVGVIGYLCWGIVFIGIICLLALIKK